MSDTSILNNKYRTNNVRLNDKNENVSKKCMLSFIITGERN